jgi:serine/threonine protein kinase/Tfp pilus assembly protein PilF
VKPEALCVGCMQDRGGAEKCPHCGWREGSAAESPLQLPPRTILDGRYLVGRALGQGGFGITYLAWDLNLDRKLAIKEYFPRDLCVRSRDECTVQALTQNARDSYEDGRGKFEEEGKTLARFQDNPGIVSVLTYFRENGTAYIVMGYMEGQTFKQYLEQHGGKLGFEEALGMVAPLMDTLKEVHAAGMLHRDISPDNIYVTRSGQMKLLDFGNARFAIGEQSRSLDVILKPGYAPYEQYQSRGKQGPWTDVYALGATLYRAVTGQTPSPAPDRMAHDDLVPPSRLGSKIPPQAESALLAALSLRQSERPQSVVDFKRALLGGVGGTAPQPVRPTPPRPTPPQPQPPQPPRPRPPVNGGAAGKTGKSPVAALVVAGVVVVVLAAAAVVWWLSRPTPGHLAITANVEAAQVAINGPVQGSCVTPCPNYILPAGNYHIVGTKAGYPNVELNTAVAAGQAGAVNLPFSLPSGAGAPASGTLTVTANVDGAQVAINGQTQPDCVTPCKLQKVPPGGYRVGAAKPGYRADEQNVTVAASQDATINLQLSPLNQNQQQQPSLGSLIERGEGQLRDRQFDSATATFREVISQGPGGAEKARAYRDLCLALGPGKKWDEAGQACRTAVSLDPNDARTHTELGVALANLSDWAGAEREDRAAVKLVPDDARMHFNLAIALKAQGKQAESSTEFNQAHQLDPGHYAQQP